MPSQLIWFGAGAALGAVMNGWPWRNRRPGVVKPPLRQPLMADLIRYNNWQSRQIELALRDEPQPDGWLPIETAPGARKMFVTIAIGVQVTATGVPYTSDPYCVWRDPDGSFARWPHPFQPTHWYPLPTP